MTVNSLQIFTFQWESQRCCELLVKMTMRCMACSSAACARCDDVDVPPSSRWCFSWSSSPPPFFFRRIIDAPPPDQYTRSPTLFGGSYVRSWRETPATERSSRAMTVLTGTWLRRSSTAAGWRTSSSVLTATQSTCVWLCSLMIGRSR